MRYPPELMNITLDAVAFVRLCADEQPGVAQALLADYPELAVGETAAFAGTVVGLAVGFALRCATAEGKSVDELFREIVDRHIMTHS
jgi:hypothetical protein